jgi:hypothetical protein
MSEESALANALTVLPASAQLKPPLALNPASRRFLLDLGERQ